MPDEKDTQLAVHLSGNHVEELDGDDSGVTIKEGQRIIRRADWRLLPPLTLLYGLSFVDRSNLGFARIVGMSTDLNLTGNKYNVILMLFFITYTIFEIPSNSILRRVSLRIYLAMLILGWGTISMCFGFTQSFAQMAGLRVLLGLFEAGFNPACLYLISSWYRRYETQKRVAIWFTGGALIAGFNGIVCYGLSQMEGLGGTRGWRWIFIIPGAVTVAAAVPFYILVSDFPEKAHWLNVRQREWLLQRLRQDRGEVEETLGRRHLIEAAWDWKVWAMAFLLTFPTAGGYTMTFFTPTILSGFGYSLAASQCLATPPYVAAAICSIITAIVADRIQRRGPFIIGYCCLVVVGFILIGWGPNNGSRLVGIFFGVVGNYCAVPSLATFLMNNTPGAAKRQVAVAVQTTMGGIGGVIGSLIFRTQDAPAFRPGLYASFGCMGVEIILTLVLMRHFHRQNKLADEQGLILEGREGFRYTI
ncbi:hypothetical protein A1O7_05189 [Cladophialophora yegresii CBS 114405]|uniref:Major facilitator superfamily (MFS) profile domain-containing protein n=1 Tax=Cladophialophora yegresii CBS 114405 TaxID=1182544 RepID=W9W926_9EURO|nr:uncharacterized protein A1O7_05189 [Cladophialophora yegresii CBS 114405]EXJ61036.1 hypothetical protein A1O7_05189 [Cladophialophora yegresii CBS 114405]